MSCIKATEILESSQFRKLSFKETLSLKMHLSMCPKCKEYKKLSNQLDSILRQSSEEDMQLSLSTEEKQVLIEKLKNIC